MSADDGRDLGVDDPGGLAGEAVEVRGEVLGLVFWRAIATDVFGAQALDRDLDDVSLTRWGGRLDEPGDVTSGGGDGLAALGKERGPEHLDGVRSQLRIEALPIELIGPEGRQKGVFAVLGELGQEVRLRWGYFVTCYGCKKDASGNVIEVTWHSRARSTPSATLRSSKPNRTKFQTLHFVFAP